MHLAVKLWSCVIHPSKIEMNVCDEIIGCNKTVVFTRVIDVHVLACLHDLLQWKYASDLN